MAINDIVQTVAEARVDARSLSEFVFKPAGFKVARRLAPAVDTLQFYINRFNSLNGDFSSSVSAAQSSLNNSVAEAQGKVTYIESTVQDAINNTAVEGGVLADTFVTVTANGVDTVARTLRSVKSESISALDYGAIGNGVADDRQNIQNALSNMVAGSRLIVPAGYTFKVINATGAGVNLVAQRANAVANNTLKALVCTASDIEVVIDGTIIGTSALDDIIRFTGDRVKITGSGSIKNISGQYLDTNSSDLTVQWRPSNLRILGNDCYLHGVAFKDAPTVGVSDYGNRNDIEACRFTGGLVTHGAGTVLFGIQQGQGSTAAKGGSVTRCTFSKSETGGAAYSGVLSVCKEANISDNYFDGLLEHGVYANSTDSIISNNRFKDIETAAAIQSFNGGTITNNRFVDCGFGQIAVSRPNNTTITGNVAKGAGLSGIAVRTGTGDSVDTIYKDLTISNNIIDFVGTQSAIDVSLTCGIDGLHVTDNQVRGNGLDSTLYGAIRLDVAVASPNSGKNLKVSGNTVNGSSAYGLYVRNFNGGQVLGNTMLNVNKVTANVAARFFNCTNIDFYKNTVHGSGKTESILLAIASDGNAGILATENNGIDLVGASGAICNVNLAGTAHSNGRNTLGTQGTLKPANVVSATVTDGAAGSARPPAQVILTPVNAVAETIQAGAQRISVTAVADGSFTWATASGNAIGTTGAIYKYDIYQ